MHDLHERFSSEINCLECAACCKTLGPAIYDKDIEKMAKALRLKPSEVVTLYLRIDEDGDYVLKRCHVLFLWLITIALFMNRVPKHVENILILTGKI